MPALIVNGVLLTQANRWASHVARVDLYLEKGEAARWRVVARAAGVDESVVGRPVRIVYSRVDADGSLREARIEQNHADAADAVAE